MAVKRLLAALWVLALLVLLSGCAAAGTLLRAAWDEIQSGGIEGVGFQEDGSYVSCEGYLYNEAADAFFAALDARDAAAEVIRCVSTSGQRFGRNRIIGILMGENTDAVRQYHLEENPSYGTQKQLGRERLGDVIRALLEQGYLRQTEDRYALLRLTGRSGELLESEEPFRISFRKEEKPAAARKKGSAAALSAEGQGLFEKLRKVRMELARKRGIPPYMVASDKTLRDMCLRRPKSEAELLEVNGMGETKVARYGKAFLEAIRESAD